MMHAPSVRLFAFLLTSVIVWACAASDQKPASSAGPSDTQTQAPARQQPVDTVDWRSAGQGDEAPSAPDPDREPRGERLGLIGPIVATGGVGPQRYIAVYDPAGVLVGALTYQEFEKKPARLDALIAKAHERGEIQNYHALQFVQFKQFAAAMAAGRK